MMRLATRLPAVMLTAAIPAYAQVPPANPVQLLQRAALSAKTLTYTGTYVHATDDRMTTARITHAVVGGDERERIETLDGPLREFVRRNDEMQCFMPDAKTVRLDRRTTGRFFPSLLSSPDAIAENYEVKLGGVERVLGLDCQWIKLEPRDALRFHQRICAEMATGLLLRARVLSDRNRVLENYTFTEVRIGAQVARSEIKNAFRQEPGGWQTDSKPRDESIAVDTGWSAMSLPSGFKKVIEMRRTMPGKPQPVSHLVFSDGLASISVFVEPAAPGAAIIEAAYDEGLYSVFVKSVGDHVVTVLGEVPPAATQMVGRGVARSR
jgi:sigma-E factor negative regulatory protein RseB